MSRDKRIHPFLCQLADMGSQLQNSQLRDAARNLLRQLPADPPSVERMVTALQIPRTDPLSQPSLMTDNTVHSRKLEDIFTDVSASTLLYHLEV